MRLGIHLTLLVVCLGPGAFRAAAQPASPDLAAAPPAIQSGPVVLGHSMHSLTEWKFHPGDNPGYAQPGYDDSGWTTVDLQGHARLHDPFFSHDSFAAGWTARGFPNLTGFAWYRTRIRLQGDGDEVWLEMPPNVDDVYQVYANGRLVGSFGKFTPDHVRAYYSRSMQFPVIRAGADTDLVLALRFYMEPDSPQWNFAAGGLHSAPTIGFNPSIALLQARNMNDNLHTFLTELLVGLLALIAGVAALVMYLMNRAERAHLWLAAALLTGAILSLGHFVASMTYLLPIIALLLIEDVFGFALLSLFWLLFWAHWFRLRNIRAVTRAGWTLALLELCIFACLREPLLGTVVPIAWAHPIWLLSAVLRGAFALLLIWVVAAGIRQNRAEGLIALPAVLLLGVKLFSTDLQIVGARVDYFPFGIHVGIGSISFCVLILVVLGLVVRRLLHSEVRQKELALEMQQAQAVQALLVPEQMPRTTGFRVEGTYLPASHVGGDFYQVLPAPEGGLIVLLGDVSGKGLQAAMVVSMVVGAVRAIARQTADPAEILGRLNAELKEGMKSGFVTCLCAHIDDSGAVTLANAGHLPPYLNGKEMPVTGALPLGILRDAAYTAEQIHLNDGDVLTMVSDGIVEARSRRTGQLYGFDRLAALLAQRPSAQQIAAEAQRFGQEDDISVLMIARLAAGVPAQTEIVNLAPA